MRKVGDRIYTINESGKKYVRRWKILEINGNQYRCENKRTHGISVLSEDEVKIYDSKEEAEKIASEMQRKADRPTRIMTRIIFTMWVCLVLFFIAIFLTMMFKGM